MSFVKKHFFILVIFMFTAGYFQNSIIQFSEKSKFKLNPKDSRSSKTMQHTIQREKNLSHLSNKGYIYSDSLFYIIT